MQIIEFNHKTVSALLKKQVEEYWMNGKDAWLKFTDGSVVCVHVIKPGWSPFVTFDELQDDRDNKSFLDEQTVWQFIRNEGEEVDEPYTSRTVAIYFDKVKYYYHENHYDYVKREYLPVIEFHYYEKGEEWE